MTGREYCALTGAREYNENTHVDISVHEDISESYIFNYLSLSVIFHDIISFYYILIVW